MNIELYTLSNGNFHVNNAYGLEAIEKGMTREGDLLWNRTDKEINCKEAYDTTANGSCDDLVVPSSCGIICKSAGNPYSFARYAIVKELPDWVIDFCKKSYTEKVNPLPHLRKLFPEFKFEFKDRKILVNDKTVIYKA